MSNTPTDAEIDAFLDSSGGIEWVIADKRERYRLLVRAVLAKWGTPQPVVREPLTDEQMRTMRKKHPAEDLCGWSYRMGIADAETHHGITGGQHDGS